MGWLWRGNGQSHLYWRCPQWQKPMTQEWATPILGLCHGFFTDWLTFRYILESVEYKIGSSSPSKCSWYKIWKRIEPSKCYANLCEIFPSSTFFSSSSFYPAFFLHFYPAFFLIFFCCWSQTLKGSLMHRSTLTWPGLILGFVHVIILFIAENVM